MKYLILLFTITFQGQVLHHQMLSSQGGVTHLPSGTVVKQTIGQQSITGNYIGKNLIAGQGFQQSAIMKKGIPQVVVNPVITTSYPNPFIDKVNFHFSIPVIGPVRIIFYDMLGRLVYDEEKTSLGNELAIDNLHFADGEYFVKLTAEHYNYSTNLLKIE